MTHPYSPPCPPWTCPRLECLPCLFPLVTFLPSLSLVSINNPFPFCQHILTIADVSMPSISMPSLSLNMNFLRREKEPRPSKQSYNTKKQLFVATSVKFSNPAELHILHDSWLSFQIHHSHLRFAPHHLGRDHPATMKTSEEPYHHLTITTHDLSAKEDNILIQVCLWVLGPLLTNTGLRLGSLGWMALSALVCPRPLLRQWETRLPSLNHRKLLPHKIVSHPQDWWQHPWCRWWGRLDLFPFVCVYNLITMALWLLLGKNNTLHACVMGNTRTKPEQQEYGGEEEVNNKSQNPIPNKATQKARRGVEVHTSSSFVIQCLLRRRGVSLHVFAFLINVPSLHPQVSSIFVF